MSNKPLVSRSGSTTAGHIAPLSRGAGTPPSQLYLTPGAHVGWGGAAVRVEAIRDRGRVLITELGTAEQLDVPIETLHVLPEQPTALAFDRVDAHPDEWARVRALALDFEVHIDLAALPAAISQALARKYGVSSRCIQRWRKRYLICLCVLAAAQSRRPSARYNPDRPPHRTGDPLRHRTPIPPRRVCLATGSRRACTLPLPATELAHAKLPHSCATDRGRGG